MRITPSKIKTRKNTTSYDITYVFRKILEGEHDFYIDGPSVCVRTTPIVDGNYFPYGKDFEIILRKVNWWGGYSIVGTKTINFNDGTSILKWSNVGSGNYNLYFYNSDGRDWIYDTDGSASIYNCN